MITDHGQYSDTLVKTAVLVLSLLTLLLIGLTHILLLTERIVLSLKCLKISMLDEDLYSCLGHYSLHQHIPITAAKTGQLYDVYWQHVLLLLAELPCDQLHLQIHCTLYEGCEQALPMLSDKRVPACLT